LKPERGRYVREYFRFYPDGFATYVIFSSRINGEPATSWGKRDRSDIYGSYRVKGRVIQIACMGHSQPLIYTGRVRKDGITITACNGRERRRFYRFYEGAEGERKSDPLQSQR
jgi:hypothetical protein